MKLLVGSMTFAPDSTGISVYATDFAVYAAEQGHEVTVATSFSWYPKWMKRPEDRRKLFRKDSYKGIKVLRGYLYVPQKITSITRILQEISFIAFIFLNFIRAGKQDAIVLFITPINLGVVGVLFRKLWGAKLIINIQDLQLDAARSLGMIKKLPMVELMSSVEKYSYNKADLVTSISGGMVSIIKDKGISPEKLYLWPNWIDVAAAHGKGVKGAFRQKFPQYADKCIVGYSGNMGVKQGLTALIDLSKQCESSNQLAFLLIGRGGDIENLKNYAKQQKVKNLDFIDFLSEKDYLNFLADADIVFLSQQKGSSDVYFPSKLLGIMANEKLLLVSADKNSELYKTIVDNKIGMAADFGDVEEMQSLLQEYLAKPKKFIEYQQNAYAFVQQYDRKAVLDKLMSQIEQI